MKHQMGMKQRRRGKIYLRRVNSFTNASLLRYEKDFQLGKRGKVESEGRAAAGREVMEPAVMRTDPRQRRHRHHHRWIFPRVFQVFQL